MECEKLLSFVPLSVGAGGMRMCATEAQCTRRVEDADADEGEQVQWTGALRVYEPSDSTDMVDYVRALAKHYEIEECEDAFYVCNLSDVVAQMARWRTRLPRVEPFYAVKCNDDRMLLGTLAALGASFDCASRGEIKRVLELGVAPERIVYANACKQVSMIRFARAAHVPRMTFDNADELRKIKAHYPDAGLLLRVLPEPVAVQCVLGNKFGASVEQAERLVLDARALGLRVEGVSFHVGSGCRDARGYALAVRRARRVWDALLDAGFEPRVLDVGGGFPGTDEPGELTFEEICESLNAALDEYFPPIPGLEIIAEPGRYFASRAFTLCCNVIAKRDSRTNTRVTRAASDVEADAPASAPADEGEVKFMYYQNDGVYGSFNCLLYDHAHVTPHYLRHSQEKAPDSERYSSILYGPTCDGFDTILRNYAMPELQTGDWIYWLAMGAYTFAAASEFNGLPKPHLHYYLSASDLPLFTQSLPLPGPLPVLVPAAEIESHALAAPASVERALSNLVQAVGLHDELRQAELLHGGLLAPLPRENETPAVENTTVVSDQFATAVLDYLNGVNVMSEGVPVDLAVPRAESLLLDLAATAAGAWQSSRSRHSSRTVSVSGSFVTSCAGESDVQDAQDDMIPRDFWQN